MNEHASIIQCCWRRRMMIKKTMNDILEELYDRHKKNIKVFLLIDTFFDINLYSRIDLYNKRAQKLFLVSFESFCITFDSDCF